MQGVKCALHPTSGVRTKIKGKIMPAHNRLLAAIVIGLSGLCSTGAAIAQENLELKPNMRAADAYELRLSGDKLLFSTYSYNIGDGPLEIVGGETGSGVQNVYQRIYSTDGSSYERRAGQFVWHPDHDHVHFTNYATYTLQPVGASGGSAREGHKTTFCLMDTNKAPAPHASSNPAYYMDCGTTIQGISVGWGDKYSWYLADQDIDVAGLPSGDYSLSIDIDPNNALLETNDTDNSSLIYVNLDFANGIVTVINEPGDPGDPPAPPVTIASITPDSGTKNSIVPVTISGSGFTDGMSVSFANGSGRAPIVNVTNYTDNQITAIVTIKKGGRKRQSTWDLRVGNGLLSNAFTVNP